MRVFVGPARLVAGALTLTGDEHHYLARVRRARVGDAVEVADGAGRAAAATIDSITDVETRLRVDAPVAAVPAVPHVRVLLPLIKGERMDDALEKLVEVGADEIVVWPAHHCVVKLDAERRDTRLARYAAALQAAARQSRRAQIPTVRYAADLSALLATLPAGGTRLVLDPASSTAITLAAPTDVTIASGPEGGLARPELAVLFAAGFTGITLGPRILRAETAPVVATALVRSATST